MWKERTHCIARHLLLIALWSCSMMLWRYFTRRCLQSPGKTFSFTEAAKASGYEARNLKKRFTNKMPIFSVYFHTCNSTVMD